MPKTTTTRSKDSERTRDDSPAPWAGTTIALGMLLFFAGVLTSNLVIDAAPTTGDGQAADSAATTAANASAFTFIRFIESFGCALVAVGALVLATRPVSARAWGGPIAWTGLGLGAGLLSATYILQGTTLVHLAENHAGNEAVYEAMWSGLTAVFGVGALLFTVASTSVFLGEARSVARHVATWAAWTGAAGWLVAIMAPVAALTGTDMGGTASWAVLVGFLAFTYWGLAHDVPGLRRAASTATIPSRARPA